MHVSDVNIAIAGKIGSAKTYCANLLVDKHGYQRMSFATPLKKLLQQVRSGDWLQMAEDLYGYPWSADDEECQRIKKDATNAAMDNIIGFVTAHKDDDDLWNGKGREFLQLIGTNYFRAHYPGIWVRLFERSFAASRKTRIVVDDVRFPDELACLKQLGFLALRCSVSEEQRIARVKPEEKHLIDHQSEHMLDGMDDEFDGEVLTGCAIELQHVNLIHSIRNALDKRSAK